MKLLIVVALSAILGVSSSPVEVDFSPFIINGVRAPVAPYFAFIQYFNNQGMGFFGGGALISTRHILTAATNVHGFALIRVFMGSANRTAMRELEVNLPATTVHPAYDPVSRANDIAFIRLVTAIIPTANIRQIMLPPNVNPPLVLPNENEEGFFTGFGFTSVASTGPTDFLHRGFQRMVGEGRCTSFFSLNPMNAFCAEDLIERANGCHGDVGNPFVLSYRRQDVLAGILTMHPPCGQLSPSAYTRITNFRQWINEQLLI